MTEKDNEYRNRSDSEELSRFLKGNIDSSKIFINCMFYAVSNMEFVNCRFDQCDFDDVSGSTFTNCSFERCHFHSRFNGKFYDCNIVKPTGTLIERSPMP